MTAFAMGISAIFADPNMAEAASYLAGGAGVPRAVRVIVSQPDESAGFGDTEILSSTFVIEVERSAIPGLARGDAFDVRGARFFIQHQPRLDTLGLVWRCGLVPDDAD